MHRAGGHGGQRESQGETDPLPEANACLFHAVPLVPLVQAAAGCNPMLDGVRPLSDDPHRGRRRWLKRGSLWIAEHVDDEQPGVFEDGA